MVNIRLNAGCTPMGRDDLGGVKVELTSRFGDDALKKALGQVSREQAAFRCSAAGVTVRNLTQNPSVGVQQATGDWEWLKEGDESLLVPGMRVTFFRSRVLREAASFVLVQHAGAYELTTDPAPAPATAVPAATAATAATAAEAAAAAAIATPSAAPATAASPAPPASPPPADAAVAAPAAAANLQRDVLPTDSPIPDARTPAATKRERPGASDAPPAASRAKPSPGDSAAGGPAPAWEATRESSRRRSMRTSEGEIAVSQGEVRISEGEVRISEEEIAEAIKEGIVEGVGGMDGGAAAAQPKEEEPKEEIWIASSPGVLS